MRHSLLMVLLLACACGGGAATSSPPSAQSDPTDPPVDTTTSSLTVEAWIEQQRRAPADGMLSGYAVAATPQEAIDGVINNLQVGFWGDSEWPTLPNRYAALDTSRPDMIQQVPSSAVEVEGQYAVAEQIQAEDLGQYASRWLTETAALLPDGAAGFAGALELSVYQAWYVAAANVLCGQVTAYVQRAECEGLESPSTTRLRLSQLADGLLFESVYADGVPVDFSGRPARPLEVVVTWTDGSSDPAPVVGIPIRVVEGSETIEDTDELPARSTDERGVASFDFAGTLPAANQRLGVDVDRSALLGSLSDAFPELALTVPFRRITAGDARIAVWIEERAVGQGTTHLSESLLAGLRESRANEVALLDEEHTAIVSEVNPETLATLADAARGRIDVLIIGKASSQLSSRMGSRSVYHEASARLAVYDVWSGAKMAELERTAQALGVGESRAARNALRQLGEELVEAVSVALKRPVASR